MIIASHFASSFTTRWGLAGCVTRGMALLLAGSGFLAGGELLLEPSFWSFVLPMWVIALGIVMTAAVTANGALAEFDDMAGMAVAVYFCAQSLIVGLLGTGAMILLGGDTAWPLAAYAALTALATLLALGALRRR